MRSLFIANNTFRKYTKKVELVRYLKHKNCISWLQVCFNQSLHPGLRHTLAAATEIMCFREKRLTENDYLYGNFVPV